MTDIQALNAILVQLGGTTAYKYNIQAYNAWSVLQGGTGAYTRDIDALNAIDVLNGGSGGHRYNINALNSIDVSAGGTGGHTLDISALTSLGTLLNQTIAHSWVEETVARLASRNTVYAGTIRYIATTGNDTTGNGTIETPYKTITKAYSVSANGDIIQLADGTYQLSDETGGYLLINTAGKGVLIKGNASDNTAVTINQTAGSFAIRHRVAGECRYENISFATNQNNPIFYVDGNLAVYFATFKNCIFTHTGTGTGSRFFDKAGDSASNTDIKIFEFDSCIFTSASNISIQGFFTDLSGVNHKYLIKNCTFNMTLQPAFNTGAGTKGSYYLYDNTFNMLGSILALQFGADTAIPTQNISFIDLRSNTVTYAATKSQHGILIGRGVVSGIVMNNKITMDGVNSSGAIGIVDKATPANVNDVYIAGNYSVAPRPIIIKGASKTVIKYNSFVCNESHYEPFSLTNHKVLADEVLSRSNVIENNNFVANAAKTITFYAASGSELETITAKTCTIDGNKYYIVTNYLTDEAGANVLWGDRAAFWNPSTNDANSTLITANELPIELPV